MAWPFAGGSRGSPVVVDLTSGDVLGGAASRAGGRSGSGGGGGGGDSGFRVPKALQPGAEDDRDARMRAARELLKATGYTFSKPQRIDVGQSGPPQRMATFHSSPMPVPRPPPKAPNVPVPKPELGDLAQRARERKERNHESAMLRVRELRR